MSNVNCEPADTQPDQDRSLDGGNGLVSYHPVDIHLQDPVYATFKTTLFFFFVFVAPCALPRCTQLL